MDHPNFVNNHKLEVDYLNAINDYEIDYRQSLPDINFSITKIIQTNQYIDANNRIFENEPIYVAMKKIPLRMSCIKDFDVKKQDLNCDQYKNEWNNNGTEIEEIITKFPNQVNSNNLAIGEIIQRPKYPTDKNSVKDQTATIKDDSFVSSSSKMPKETSRILEKPVVASQTISSQLIHKAIHGNHGQINSNFNEAMFRKSAEEFCLTETYYSKEDEDYFGQIKFQPNVFNIVNLEEKENQANDKELKLNTNFINMIDSLSAGSTENLETEQIKPKTDNNMKLNTNTNLFSPSANFNTNNSNLKPIHTFGYSGKIRSPYISVPTTYSTVPVQYCAQYPSYYWNLLNRKDINLFYQNQYHKLHHQQLQQQQQYNLFLQQFSHISAINELNLIGNNMTYEQLVYQTFVGRDDRTPPGGTNHALNAIATSELKQLLRISQLQLIKNSQNVSENKTISSSFFGTNDNANGGNDKFNKNN